MERRKEMIELAGLLDGELDARRAEQLYELIKTDDDLRHEFEQQRTVKTALGSLPEAEAPDFMTTRVLGRIAERRADRKVSHWRTLTAELGGFAFCLMLVTGMLIFNNTNLAPMNGKGGSTLATAPASGGPVQPLDAGLMDYARLSEAGLPAGAGGDAEDFLQFVSEQHGYSRLVNSSSSMTPDMPGALLVLDGKVYFLEVGGN